MPETEHKGLPVRKHSAAVRGASGDALNGAMKVSPQDLDPGQSAYIVLEVQPNGDQFKPMDDGEAWEHVDILKVLRGAFLPGKEALPFLDNVTVKLEEIRVEETGQERLAMDTKLEDDHRAGLHKRKRKGCKLCEAVAEEGARELANSAPKRPGGRRGRGAPKGGKVVDAADRF